MDSTEAIAGMPVRFGWMKTWQTNMLIAPRPAGGLISPTYRIDPRAVHMRWLCLSGRTGRTHGSLAGCAVPATTRRG